MITIFTDGSSRGNPGPGGWGAIVSDGKVVTELGGGEGHTTNNRMELTGAIKALEFAGDSKITIYTDSEYVLKGITEWIHNWQKKGWKTRAKKPVENQDLWQELLKATDGKNIEWKLVRGHTGVHANERCDEIATSFADSIPTNLYKGPQNHYKISLNA